jgi:YggT family protein
MEALRYIVDTLLWLLMLAFVLRFLFQLVRADFRDPMADAIVRVTNWLTGATLGLSGYGFGELLPFLRITALSLVDMVLRIYLFALLLYWLTSFVSPGGYAPGLRLLAQLCEPVLKPVRRVIPRIGQVDFSVLWVSIAIGAVLILVR